MRIIFQKSFQKDFAKCSLKVQMQAENRVELFFRDRFHPLLNLHMLKGEYVDCWSLNVNSDVRIIFMLSGDTMYLIRIGTHSQLYGIVHGGKNIRLTEAGFATCECRLFSDHEC